MPIIVVLTGVTPSDLMTVEEFFVRQLTEDLYDIIAEETRECALVRQTPRTEEIAPPLGDLGLLPREMVFLSMPVGGYRIQGLPPPNNLKCWYCDLQFAGHPWFIPYDMRHERNNQVVLLASGISGNFCSEVCAYGWLPQLASGSVDRYSQLLQTEVLARTGVASFRIPDPLPKTERIEYGGGLTEKEFREELRSRLIEKP